MGRVRLRLRTKFLIAMLLTSAGLTAVSLLIVQRTVENQVRRDLSNDLANSVETFRNAQKEREAVLARSAKLMADFPSLKALMTSRHPPTIQDASEEMLRLSGGDLFALLDPTSQFVGFHTKAPGITREQAQQLLEHRNSLDQPLQWWFAGGHLYEVVLVPIYFGPSTDNSLLGVVAVGDEMNAAVARQVSQIAASQVTIVCGSEVVVSTLNAGQRSEVGAYLEGQAIPGGPIDWKLGGESFVVSSLALDPGEAPAVTMLVMKSYDEATAFLNHLRRLLLAVGLGAVFVGSVLVYVTARTFTRPLEELVDGVRALGKGDFRYPVEARGASEIAELTNAFSLMRESLHQAQQRLLNAERLATIGRMASSISHDLRHPLTAVLANAEFLADADLNRQQREELYQEIRIAVNRLTDLVDSLLELSRPADSLNLSEAPIERTISRAIELVQAHPQFHKIMVSIESPGLHSAQFDPRKMERVFYNLLLNGCQAAQVCGGHVAVHVAEVNGNLEIRTTDDGPGVESSLRDKLFQPFVSHGKENGTGLGLTIAQKIVQDHDGTLELESSVPGRTVMQIVLPRVCKKIVTWNGRTADASQPFTV
ncbi:MAG: HAMP domain-containing sensor histidine kinase [Candidatus Korobacteraceae bacterium]